MHSVECKNVSSQLKIYQLIRDSAVSWYLRLEKQNEVPSKNTKTYLENRDVAMRKLVSGYAHKEINVVQYAAYKDKFLLLDIIVRTSHVFPVNLGDSFSLDTRTVYSSHFLIVPLYWHYKLAQAHLKTLDTHGAE